MTTVVLLALVGLPLGWRLWVVTRERDAARAALRVHEDALSAEVVASREATRLLDRALEGAGAAARAKSTFLANMSHELRTPLNAIIGYSEMLREDLEGEQAEDVSRILGSAQKLLVFIGDVLDLSTLEAGEAVVQVEPIEFATLVSQAANRLGVVIQESGNRLQLQIEGSVGEVFHTDGLHVAAALEALLDNAAKFTRDGTVTVSASEQLRQGRRWLRIAVTDTGIGVGEGELERLFDPFPSTAGTRPLEGGRLSLSKAQRYLRMLGGDLYVTSALGEGSCFTIEVPDGDLPDQDVDSLFGPPNPLDQRPEAMVSAVAVQRGAPRGPVLLVEDDPPTRELLARALRREGLRVDEASNGIEALYALRRSRYAVVLLDLRLPEMDGFAVIEAIHADPRLRGTPVMVCTAMELDVPDRARLQGAVMVAKNDLSDPSHIIRGVRAHLHR